MIFLRGMKGVDGSGVPEPRGGNAPPVEPRYRQRVWTFVQIQVEPRILRFALSFRLGVFFYGSPVKSEYEVQYQS